MSGGGGGGGGGGGVIMEISLHDVVIQHQGGYIPEY